MKRILVKLSGEMLGSPGIDYDKVRETAKRLSDLQNGGLELCFVIGGGNILRGIHLESSGIDRTPADQMGMLATLINGVALKAALEQLGERVTLISALDCPSIADPFRYDRAQGALKEGHLVIFVGGTGNPYFTTDTCAALRACEMGVDLLVKATKVDAIYDRDPKKDKHANKFTSLTWTDFIDKQLKVMDLTAVSLCRDQQIPIFVCDMTHLGQKSFEDLISKQQGTLIKG